MPCVDERQEFNRNFPSSDIVALSNRLAGAFIYFVVGAGATANTPIRIIK
jgi:hypothetical protein